MIFFIRPLFIVIISCTFFAPTSLEADIYMYVDKNGIVHFSNTPVSSKYKFFIKEKNKEEGYSYKDTGIDQSIKIAGNHYKIDPLLIKALIRAESNFNPEAVSPKGARGLMQLMPATIKKLEVNEAFNPRENIMAGTRYLRIMLDTFDNEVKLALAAYNAGPSNVKKYKGIPPFPETQNYVKKVLKFWDEYKKESDQSFQYN